MMRYIQKFLLRIINFILTKISNKYLIRIKRFLLTLKADVIFVSEGSDWSIYWDGKQIAENINKTGFLRVVLGTPRFRKNKIIHFGSINCLITPNEFINVNNSNKLISLWAHIVPGDPRLKYVPLLNKKLEILHTPSLITKKILIDSGFDEKKIYIFPIGVDLSYFKCYEQIRREELRKKFKLPKDKIIIGSFQKDGIGWGEGLKPKLEKGPDIFCKVVKKMHNDFKIHVFLTGPARGYVKEQLEKSHIPYTHIFLKNYLDIVDCYNVLDLYIIASRSEGGPKALLEGMATGVPLVTTNVGMVPYLIKNGVNGYVAEVDNIEQIYNYSVKLLRNKDLKKKFIKNGLKTIQNFSWETIAKEYYLPIYKRLINDLV